MNATQRDRVRGSSPRLREVQGNQAALRILRFFSQNRYTMDTADSIAIWVGFPRESAASALNTLVEARYLERIGEGDEAVFLVAPTGRGRFPDFEEIESLIKEQS